MNKPIVFLLVFSLVCVCHVHSMVPSLNEVRGSFDSPVPEATDYETSGLEKPRVEKPNNVNEVASKSTAGNTGQSKRKTSEYINCRAGFKRDRNGNCRKVA